MPSEQKRLTPEELAAIEYRTKGRLEHIADDGWELEDIMALQDHIVALEAEADETWHRIDAAMEEIAIEAYTSGHDSTYVLADKFLSAWRKKEQT